MAHKQIPYMTHEFLSSLLRLIYLGEIPNQTTSFIIDALIHYLPCTKCNATATSEKNEEIYGVRSDYLIIILGPEMFDPSF